MFTFKHAISSILMLFALAWLTVSTPFVYAEQQLKKDIAKEQKNDTPAEESEEAPVTNTSEEKTESGNNNLSEYLHDTHLIEHAGGVIVKYYKCHPSDLYFAYKPESVSPPPKA